MLYDFLLPTLLGVLGLGLCIFCSPFEMTKKKGTLGDWELYDSGENKIDHSAILIFVKTCHEAEYYYKHALKFMEVDPANHL